MSLQDQIAKSFTLRAQGALSDFDLGVLHQRRAAERGESLDQYYKSAEGQKALLDATRTAYYAMQSEGSLGNAHEPLNKARSKGRAVPSVPKRPGPATGGMDHDWNDGPGEGRDMTSDDLNDDAEKTASAIKRHMASGDSYDAAVTKVLREQRGY
jgi:hypothetical protein